MSDFAQRLREARERRDWDQATLVRRLAVAGARVSQQTVSRWERGQTSPSGPHLAALSDLLDLAPASDDLEAPATDASHAATEVRPALVTQLRFDALNPEQFESFAADLASALFAPDRAVRAGAQGHQQDGVDVIVEHVDGAITGIQCKREKEFGPAKVKKAVDALKIDVREARIYLSRVASPAARTEMRRHPGWGLWDADDLSRAVRELPREAALRIVDTYFPRMREPFLGIATPSPWQDTAAFYAPFMGDHTFTHRWPLLGQQDVLDKVVGAVSTASTPVTALLGRGGLGKSRLLRDVAARVHAAGTEVRFLTTSAPVSPVDFDLLPRDDLLVIIDDAHDRSDLALIVAGIGRERPDARILLALRPYGWDSCVNALSSIGLHPTEVPTITLADLSSEAAEELAWAALPEAARWASPYLGAIGRDCPLLIVIGAALIGRDELNAGDLASDPAMSQVILTKFADVVTGDGGTPASELRQAVLRALAVLQPLRTDVDAFRDAMSVLTGCPYDQVSAELDTLEDAGVVLRRGASLRVVPDLLGDALVEQAFFDKGGFSSGYVDRVRSGVSNAALDNALRNAARVDWRAAHQRGASTAVIEPLWGALDAEFKASGIAGRRRLAETLRAIAPFQPGRTLDLLQWAVDHPTLEDDDAAWFWDSTPTYDSVLHDLAPALPGVCVSPTHFVGAADLLWRLGRTDHRPLHQHPDHPVRMLSELASFERHKPTWVTHAVIDRVTHWLDDLDTWETAYSPLEVLRPVLATEGHSHRSDGHTVTFTPFAMNPAGVATMRRTVLDLAFPQLRHVDVRQAVRAVDVIRDGLGYPTGQFGRTVEAEEREAWTPLILEAMNGLRDAVAGRRLDPAAEVAIRFALRWHEHSSGETKEAAEAVVAELSPSIEAQVARYLHDGWNQLDRDRDDYETAAQAREEMLRKVAQSLSELPAESVAELVSRRLVADRRAFEDRVGFPSPFFRILFAELPAVAAAVCDTVALEPASPLFAAVADAVTALIRVEPTRAATSVGRLAAGADPLVDRQLASALTRSRREGEAVSDDDKTLLLKLAASPDVGTRREVAHGARVLARIDSGVAARILLAIAFEDSTDIADAIFGAFTRRHGHLNWLDLPEPSRAALMGRLLRAPSLEDYQIMLFLSERSTEDPDMVLRLLLDRIERSESVGPDYRPLPYRWHEPLQFRSTPSFGAVMRAIRDWVATSPEAWQRTRYGADLFRGVARDFDDQVLQVLEDGVATGEPSQVRAVGALLSEAPRALVWDRKDTVVDLIRSAAAVGPGLGEHIARGLDAAVSSGIRSGTPGEPFAEDVEQRDRSRRVLPELAYGSVERRFYESLARSAESAILWARRDREINGDGRRW